MPPAPLRPRLRSSLLAAALAPWLVTSTARADGPDADHVPVASSSFSMTTEASAARPPVTLPPAGESVAWRDRAVHVRLPVGDVRLWPGGLLQLDARGAFGRGVSDVTGVDSPSLVPRLGVRRARLDLSGQFRRAWSFYVSGDFAGTPHLEYAIIDVGFGDVGHLSIGRQLVPIGMANRTFEPAFVGFERPLAVRFAQPSDKDLGALAWGELAGGILRAELGVFGGDGGRSNVDRAVDAAARLVVRPFRFTRSVVRHVQIGVSGSDGTRQADRVNYAFGPVTTEGGFAFWRPGRTEAGQALSVIPSGTQQVAAAELWAPIWRFDLRAEFLYTKRHTREAVAGQDEPAGSARFGQIKGSSAYASLGFWLLGTPAVLAPPGQFQPRHPAGDGPDGRGLLVVVRGELLDATYDPGSRAKAAGDTLDRRDIRARVLDAGLNYYAGQHAAVLAHYTYTQFPDSSVPELAPTNLARAPGNLVGRSGAHQVHEVGARIQVSF